MPLKIYAFPLTEIGFWEYILPSLPASFGYSVLFCLVGNTLENLTDLLESDYSKMSHPVFLESIVTGVMLVLTLGLLIGFGFWFRGKVLDMRRRKEEALGMQDDEGERMVECEEDDQKGQGADLI
jgi:uncharacterized membrane protein YdjX (TVP38/TMEM64 family)